MEADWATASQAIGTAHRSPAKVRQVQEQRVAGLRSSEVAYAAAANEFPRCERQLIRAIFDPDITSGAKRPPSELLRRYPSREFPERLQTGRPPTSRPATGQLLADRPPTGWIDPGQQQAARRSRPNTGASGLSAGSRRSSTSAAGFAIARPLATPGPSPDYFRQVRTPDSVYQTSSSRIGAGGPVPREPCPGREVWMLGRGGGQQSSFDSCLVHKGHYAPLTVMT